MRRDRYGNPISPQQAETKTLSKGTRGYVSPGGGDGSDPNNNKGAKHTMGGDSDPYGRSGGNSRPTTPGKGGDGYGYPGSGGKSDDYGFDRNQQGRQNTPYNPAPKRPVDPNDPLSIAGLDYGKGLPKDGAGGSGTKGGPGGNTGTNTTKPAEVHKATSGTGKGGAVRRNVVPGDGGKVDAGSGGSAPQPGPSKVDPSGGKSIGGAPLPTPGSGTGVANPGGASSGSQSGKAGPGDTKPTPKDGDDDIVIADDVDIQDPDHKELLPMDFDDDDEDQPGTGGGSSRPTNPANKMSAGTGTFKPGARKVVPGSGGSGQGMDGGDSSDKSNQPNKIPQQYDQDPLANSQKNPNSGLPRSGDDFDPNSQGQLKPTSAPDGTSGGEAPAITTPPEDPTKQGQGSVPPPPPAAHPDQLNPGSNLLPSDPTKKKNPGTDKGGNTLTIDPPDPSKARRKSVRPDGQNLPPTPPNDQEKLTTLEDLVNASDTVEFEDKLGKYTQSKGAA